MIQEFSNGDVPQQEPAGLDDVANQPVKPKRRSPKDSPYRPSNPAKKKAGKTNRLDDLGQPEAQNPVSGDIQSPVLDAEDTTAQGGVGISAEVPGDGVNAQEVLWLLDQREILMQDGDVPKQENTVDDQDISEIAEDKNEEESIGAAEATSALNAQPPKVSFEPVTPVKQKGGLASPLTEEIYRDKISTSPGSVSSPPGPITGSPSMETASLMDMILEAARAIYQFSKYPHGVSKGVHARIIQAFRKDHQEVIGASNLNQWFDGSIWIRVLDIGLSANQKVTILNMLEYMGAWEWYDR
jgi:hypothetical protein